MDSVCGCWPAGTAPALHCGGAEADTQTAALCNGGTGGGGGASMDWPPPQAPSLANPESSKLVWRPESCSCSCWSVVSGGDAGRLSEGRPSAPCESAPPISLDSWRRLEQLAALPVGPRGPSSEAWRAARLKNIQVSGRWLVEVLLPVLLPVLLAV